MTKLTTISEERKRLLLALDEGSYSTITDLCEQAGVSRDMYYTAIKDEEFVSALFQTTSGKIYKSIPKIMDKVVQQAERGSFPHQKMLFEMMKIYQGVPQQQINVDNRSVTFEVKLTEGDSMDDHPHTVAN